MAGKASVVDILLGTLGAVILGVGTYIAVQIPRMKFELERLNEKHAELAASVDGIKQSVLKIALSKDPKSLDILNGLVDARTATGSISF